ncbi:MAG: sigma-70 family RNA polymerase sigma factor [Methylobacter sp.]
MLLYQEGDLKAFEILYIRHKDRLVRFLYKKCFDPHLSEDLSQRTWVKIIKLAERNGYAPDQRASFKTYLYTIAINDFLDYRLQAHNRIANNGIDFSDLPESTINSLFKDNSDPLKTEIAKEIRELYLQTLQQLPDEQRDVVLLKLDAEFSFEEISSLTGVPFETVRTRYRYAIKKLREALKDHRTIDDFNMTDYE